MSSLVPALRPLLVQAIAGLGIEYTDRSSREIVMPDVLRLYPNQVRPWTDAFGHHDRQRHDPREIYQEKDRVAAERYIRAGVKIYAHWHSIDFRSPVVFRLLNPLNFDWRQGSLLFSLPCISDAWERISAYADECGYIRNVCATPWNKVPQPLDPVHISRFAIIFTAFLRLQASTIEHAELLHPVIWEQLLLYIAEFLRLSHFHRDSGDKELYKLNAEEESFIRRSGQEIFCKMLQDKHASEGDLSTLSFAVMVQFPDLDGIGQQNKPGVLIQQKGLDDPELASIDSLSRLVQLAPSGIRAMSLLAQKDSLDEAQQPTTLFRLRRRHHLLRFLFLSMTLGNARKSLTNWSEYHESHLWLPPKFDFMFHFPDRYLISLIQLLDYALLTDVEHGSTVLELTSEIIRCVAHIQIFLTRDGPGNRNFTLEPSNTPKDFSEQAFEEAFSDMRPHYLKLWKRHRPGSYINAVRLALDKLAAFIRERDNVDPHQQVRSKLIAALVECELCLQIVHPSGQHPLYTPTFLPTRKLVEYILIIPTLDPRSPVSASTVWNGNPVFYLLWRSLKERTPAAVSEEFLEGDGIKLLVDGVLTAKANTRWTKEEFECYTLLIAVVLLGFVQGLTENDPASILPHLSSPNTLSALCSISFPAFYSHPSYRVDTGHKPSQYDHDVLWDTLIALTKKDAPLFTAAWEAVLQSDIALVNPVFKHDYERVEELKSLLGLSDDERYIQFVVVNKAEVPTELKGKEQELMPPQADKVKIDFNLLKSYLDGKMRLPTSKKPQDTNPDEPVKEEASGSGEEAPPVSSFGTLAQVALASRRFRNSVPRDLSQV